MSFDPSRGRRRVVLALVATCFVYRLAFGLASNFWTEDERQVYLIGLQSYARHAWPYFGADVVWSESRLPGALQGVLVAAPLAVWHAPESPIVLLNLISFGALAAFAWYLGRRLPEMPEWFIWGWVMTAPWTLHFSTHVLNTSYVLAGAIAFFIGFCEAVPALSSRAVGIATAWALMGFGLVWILQIHLSFALLPAYVLVAAVSLLRQRPRTAVIARAAAAFVLGAAVPGALLVPTLLRGGAGRFGGMERNVVVQPRGLLELATLLARFLSFASVEINRFIGLNFAERLSLLVLHWWLAPFAVALLAAALVQPVVLFAIGLRSRTGHPEWRAVRLLAAGTVLWLYVSYWFSIREPQAHAAYPVLPVATLFAMYGYAPYISRPWVRRTLAALLVVNAAFHAGFAAVELGERSLYQNRALVQRAIDLRNDRLLGDRRVAAGIPAALDPPPRPPPLRFAEANPVRDLDVVRADWTVAARGRLSLFDLTVRNAGRDAAYVDLRYRVRYFGRDGAARMESYGVLKYILEPGASHRWPHVADNVTLDPSIERAALEIVDAERVVPVPEATTLSSWRPGGPE